MLYQFDNLILNTLNNMQAFSSETALSVSVLKEETDKVLPRTRACIHNHLISLTNNGMLAYGRKIGRGYCYYITDYGKEALSISVKKPISSVDAEIIRILYINKIFTASDAITINKMSIVSSVSAPTLSRYINALVDVKIVKYITKSGIRLFYLATKDTEVLLNRVLDSLSAVVKSKNSAISKIGYAILKELYERDTSMTIHELMDAHGYGAYMTWNRYVNILEEDGLITLVFKNKRAAYRISEKGIETYKNVDYNELQVVVDDTIELDTLDIKALEFMEKNHIDSMCNSLSANKISQKIHTTHPTMLRHVSKLLRAGYIAQGLSGNGKAYYITDLGKRAIEE